MTGERFFHIVIPLCIGIVGFIIAISTMRLAARYFALYVSCLSVRFDGHLTVISFLMAQSYSSFICFLAWTSNIFARSPSKRAVALAFINAFSQLGNVAGSWVSCVVCCSPPLALILSGQVYMAKVLGSDLCPFVRDLHFDDRALHCHVLHPQAGALQREQRSAGAWVLGRPRVSIYTLRRINIMEGITT